MAWITVQTKPGAGTKAVPAATIGYGRVELNKAACELLGDYTKYSCVEFLIDSDTQEIGMRFLEDFTFNSVPIKRKATDGKPVAGLTISSKSLMQELFGEEGVSKKGTRHQVMTDPEDKAILVIKPAK